MNVRPVGERGLLVELPDNATAQQFARHVRDRLGDRVQEVVPGHATVLVVGTRQRPPAAELSGWTPGPQDARPESEALEIPVTYDGPDLDTVARAAGSRVRSSSAAMPPRPTRSPFSASRRALRT